LIPHAFPRRPLNSSQAEQQGELRSLKGSTSADAVAGRYASVNPPHEESRVQIKTSGELQVLQYEKEVNGDAGFSIIGGVDT
jgi:hypothetical protein